MESLTTFNINDADKYLEIDFFGTLYPLIPERYMKPKDCSPQKMLKIPKEE